MVTAIVTILMFLVMISLHEFGHFITAKLMNFKILEYSIGFGPAIWHSKKTEIKYSLRCIPFGGYCKFEGEDEHSDDPRAFSNRPTWQRIIVVAAGGIFNVILGFVILIVIVASVGNFATNKVEQVVPNSYAEQTGIAPGDKIVAINGKSVNFYSDITLYTQSFKADEEAEITVKRGADKLKFKFRTTENTTEYTYTEDGIEVRDFINGAGGEPVLYPYNEANPKDESKVGTTESGTRYIIGFVPRVEKVNALNIWGEAWNETCFVVKLVYNSLWQLVTGKVGVDQMSGPVGVVSEVHNAVSSGSKSWLSVLNLTALLTINLGVFNLLPIPALDGGRLFFMLIELITRKRIPPEKEGMVHAIGFLLLIALIIFISYHDIMRLITG